MKNKDIIVILMVIMCIFTSGIFIVRNNYRLGRDIYHSAHDMEVQSRELANAIAYLLEESVNFNKKETINTHSFEQAMVEVHLHFGHEEVPLTEDVYSEWLELFDKIYQHRVVNKSSEYIVKTIEENSDEWAKLKIQLENMAQYLEELCVQYEQMSIWEKGFISWKNVKKILSDKIGIPNYEK